MGEVKQPTLCRPYFLVGAGYAVVCLHPLPSEKPRARGTPRVPGASKFTQVGANKNARTRGPRHLAIPRLVETGSAASPPNPRRPARGVSRSAPQCPRWTYPFRQPFFPFGLSGCLSTAVGPGRSEQPMTGCRHPPSRGPVARGWRAGTSAAWTAGTLHRISDAKEFPGHRSPLHVWRR